MSSKTYFKKKLEENSNWKSKNHRDSVYMSCHTKKKILATERRNLHTTESLYMEGRDLIHLLDILTKMCTESKIAHKKIR